MECYNTQGAHKFKKSLPSFRIFALPVPTKYKDGT